MRDGQIAVIVNPAAGGGKTQRALPRINAALAQLGKPYTLHVTTGPGDATPTATRLSEEGARVVIAVGGDGTINEVVNGLHAASRRAALGVVAIGSGSDFARTIGTPKALEDAIARAVTAEPRPIDLGCARLDSGRSHAFINVAGLGFDAACAERANRSKLPGANLPYLSAALRTLIGFENIHVTVTADDQTVETAAVFVQIANAQYMGGGFQIAPMAELSDGLFDVAIVGDFNKKELLRHLPKVYGGKHIHLDKFIHLRAKSVRVEPARPAQVQLDGELIGYAPVTFTIEPGAIELAG